MMLRRGHRRRLEQHHCRSAPSWAPIMLLLAVLTMYAWLGPWSRTGMVWLSDASVKVAYLPVAEDLPPPPQKATPSIRGSKAVALPQPSASPPADASPPPPLALPSPHVHTTVKEEALGADIVAPVRKPRYPVCPRVPGLLQALGSKPEGSEEGEVWEAKRTLYTLMQRLCDDQTPQVPPSPGGRRAGVVYTAGEKHYPNLMLSLYSLIKHHNSTLPVEVWVDVSELSLCHDKIAKPFTPNISPGQPPKPSRAKGGGGVTCRQLPVNVTGWLSKMSAISGSSFDDVLFLDSDSVPALDPAFLFHTPQYTRTGCVFWPDYWGEGCKDVGRQGDIFKAASPRNALYTHKIAGLEWQAMWEHAQEMETGQLLLDRHRFGGLLELTALLTTPETYWQKALYGDKDAFRFAWLMMQQPFHFVRLPPGHSGHVVEADGAFQRNGIAQYWDGDYPLTSLPPLPDLQTVEGAGIAVDRHLQTGGANEGRTAGLVAVPPEAVYVLVGPLFLHQMNMRDPSALQHIAYPSRAARRQHHTYCAPLHPGYFVWGVDLRDGGFNVTTYNDRHVPQANAMFEFARQHKYFH